MQEVGINKYRKKYQTGGNAYQQFYKNYISSPVYRERLVNAGYSNPDDVIRDRLNEVLNTEVFLTNKGDSNAGTPNKVYINTNQANIRGNNFDMIAAHEYSHKAGAMNKASNINPNLNPNRWENTQLRNWNMERSKVNTHLGKPYETKADIDSLRFLMEKNSLGSPAEEMTEERLKKAKQIPEIGGSYILERLSKRYKEPDLIWLMNNIAYQNQQDNPTAQSGGLADLKSIYGYAENSPFRNAPYLDIQTPEGLITMENTPHDLLGIDNLGNVQMMKANTKNPYKFKGTQVREIPLQMGGIPNAGYPGMVQDPQGDLRYAFEVAQRLKTKKNGDFKALIPLEAWTDELLNYTEKFKIVNKKGEKFVKVRGNVPQNQQQAPPPPDMGNPYLQSGGFSSKQLFDFLFDDDEEEKPKDNPATAPSTEEVDMQTQMNEIEAMKRQLQDQQDENLALGIAMESRRNPYIFQPKSITGNPYTGDILSSGQFGNQNVGEYGRAIYSNLVTDLGYAPVANSIFRSKSQNDALIAAGKPAVSNSWHLSGNAVDLKPTDWHRLSDQQQLFYRSNYDVVYHDNHYHIEPKK